MNTNYPRHLLTGPPIHQLYSVAAWAQTQSDWNRTRTWNWLMSANPELKPYLRSWPSVWSKAGSSVTSSSMARRAEQQAHRLVSHVITPTDLRTKSTPNARRAVSILGHRMLQLRDGDGNPYRAIQHSSTSLGIVMGATKTAAPALNHAVTQRWLTTEKRPGHAPIWKLRQARGSAVKHLAAMDAVDVLSGKDDTIKSPLAELIAHADHPVWNALGSAAWVEAVRQSGIVGGEEFPQTMTRQAHARARKLLDEHGWEVLAYPHEDWMRETATKLGAYEERERLQALHDARHEEQVRSLEDVRRVRNLVTPCPKTTDGLDAWFTRMFSLMQAETERRAEVRSTVFKRMDKCGFEPQMFWQWLTAQWALRAPVETGQDEEKVRAQRRAVSPAVVALVMGKPAEFNGNEKAERLACEGLEWVARKTGTKLPHSVRPAEAA